MKESKPLYFYHLINKNSNLEKGIISLQYMYNNKMYDLFDKNAAKYTHRITNEWNIEKYKGRSESSLSREEIIDALNIFRGEYGASYIYFFRYPPKKELGKNMVNVLKYKDIYRIDINSEKTKSYIKDIFYGFNNSHSDEEMLNKEYYENITEKNYFSKYDDNSNMIFSKLNHIAISFKDDYCPKDILEKC